MLGATSAPRCLSSRAPPFTMLPTAISERTAPTRRAWPGSTWRNDSARPARLPAARRQGTRVGGDLQRCRYCLHRNRAALHRQPEAVRVLPMDDPDPRSRLVGWRISATCTAENLKAESDWIHTNIPGAKTFITLMNLSSSRRPSFDNTYNPANSHVDLYGIDPYPCRTELHGCDYDMINRYVSAALSWGVPRESIVPVYQTFGGGDWDDGDGGRYVLPTASEQRQILSRWGTLIATPVFDFAYSWGSQKRDVALEGAPDLQEVFSIHNSPATTVSNQAAPPREIRVGQ